MFQKGIGTEINLEQSLYYYKRSAAQDNYQALNNLGYFYEKGVCVPQDYANAISLYKRAADKGTPSALNNLGNLLFLFSYSFPPFSSYFLLSSLSSFLFLFPSPIPFLLSLPLPFSSPFLSFSFYFLLLSLSSFLLLFPSSSYSFPPFSLSFLLSPLISFSYSFAPFSSFSLLLSLSSFLLLFLSLFSSCPFPPICSSYLLPIPFSFLLFSLSPLLHFLPPSFLLLFPSSFPSLSPFSSSYLLPIPFHPLPLSYPFPICISFYLRFGKVRRRSTRATIFSSF